MGEEKTPAWVLTERHVAGLLAELSDEGYLVLNNIGFKYGNIDHLVIRPDGVIFLLETKSHRNRVTWSGRQLLLNGKPFRENYLCQVNRSIRWLRQTAKRIWKVNPWFVAIIVFPNADVDIKRPVKHVHVMNSRELVRFIRET
jgi:hypothetical protein